MTRTGLRGAGTMRMGCMGAMRQTTGMGDWWGDLTSSVSNALNPQNWNLNPTASPYWSSTVAPALNVVGGVVGTAVVGAPIPLGTLTTALAGGAPAPQPQPTAQQPYQPAQYTQPALANTAAQQAAPAGAAKTDFNPTTMFLLAAALGLGVWAVARTSSGSSSGPAPRTAYV